MNTGYIIYVIDTETTGLDFKENDVIEISASRFHFSNPEKIEQKTWYLKALNPITIQDEALAVNKHKREDILHLTKFGRDTYKDPSEAIIQIEQWVHSDKMSAMDRVIAGQNVMFDVQALKALWEKVESLDTKMLALIVDICTGKRRRYYNLGTLVKSFNVKKRKAHRAEDDVAMTLDLLIKILTPLTDPAIEAFKDCYINLDDESI